MKVKLGDVASESRETISENKRRLPVVGLENLTSNELTLSAWSVDTENTFTKLFRKGQILFGRRRAYLKKAAVAPFDGICSGDITVIEAISGKILPELLPFVIQNDIFFDFAIEKSAGSLSPRVKWEHLCQFEFNLPPFTEQRKLSDLLWAINSTREAYKKLLDLTDELVKSRFRGWLQYLSSISFGTQKGLNYAI
jgi:type I restriction enzyme S subunit